MAVLPRYQRHYTCMLCNISVADPRSLDWGKMVTHVNKLSEKGGKECKYALLMLLTITKILAILDLFH